MLAGAQVEWCVEVANRKVFRRTQSPHDVVTASTRWFSNHEPHDLQGTCHNFIAGKYVQFGTVQYIQHSTKAPGIRLRFTPSAGLIYGTDREVRVGKDPLDEEFLEERIYKSKIPRIPGEPDYAVVVEVGARQEEQETQ